MPRYAPQSLPTGGTRPSPVQQRPAGDMEPQPSMSESGQPAVLLAQHIRREHGMQGVRGYIVAMRDYLAQPEYLELCRAMGVSPDIQMPSSHRAPAQSPPQPQVVQDPPPVQPQQSPQQNGNQMQMLQMLMQLMGMQNGGGMGSGGGFNPMMLAQLLGMQSGGNPMAGMQGGGTGSGGGFNPMMLAQLLGNMQGSK